MGRRKCIPLVPYGNSMDATHADAASYATHYEDP